MFSEAPVAFLHTYTVFVASQLSCTCRYRAQARRKQDTYVCTHVRTLFIRQARVRLGAHVRARCHARCRFQARSPPARADPLSSSLSHRGGDTARGALLPL